jgi:hypothetical protein
LTTERSDRVERKIAVKLTFQGLAEELDLEWPKGDTAPTTFHCRWVLPKERGVVAEGGPLKIVLLTTQHQTAVSIDCRSRQETGL